MDIFGIGPLELLLVLILALIFFGPDRLPAMGAKLGKSMREMRQATREFSREIESAREAIETPVAELKEPLKEVAQPFEEIQAGAASLSKAAQAARSPGKTLRDTVMRELNREDEAEEEVAEEPIAEPTIRPPDSPEIPAAAPGGDRPTDAGDTSERPEEDAMQSERG